MSSSRLIDHFKATIIINNKLIELGRTFYTYKQAEDYCKQHYYELYTIEEVECLLQKM